MCCLKKITMCNQHDGNFFGHIFFLVGVYEQDLCGGWPGKTSVFIKAQHDAVGAAEGKECRIDSSCFRQDF